MNAKPARDWLAWGALVAALGVTASAEWELARSCGFGTYVAAGVPAALDIYAVRALRAKRDVAAVVIAMVAVQALAHLVAAHLLRVNVLLVITVSAIAPLVLWRVHRIGHTEAAPEPVSAIADTTPAPQVSTETPQLSRVVEPLAPAMLPVVVEQVDTEADTRTVRLDAEAAKEAIEEAFREGLSIRDAATKATRSPSYVQAVYARLSEAVTAAA